MGESTWTHQNKEWQQTLDLARSFGWPTPRKLGSHGGLLMPCPVSDARHRIRIYSTGNGTESVAIDARKKIRNCAHRDLTAVVARITVGLSGAERLLTAAECLLDATVAERRMEALLDNLTEADDQLKSVASAFDAAASDVERAQTRVDEPLRGRSPSDLADEAGSSLRGARLELRDELPKQHDTWEGLRQEHQELTSRLAEVRRRLRERDPDDDPVV